MSADEALDAGCGLITLDDILSAAEALKDKVHQTPVLTSTAISQLATKSCGRSIELVFKCENFQKTGSFKARGATNAVSKLTDEERARGVCTHSSGNHAQALAFAAQSAGVKDYVVMPSTASAVKRQAVAETYGGEVIECGPHPSDREQVCSSLIAEKDLVFVHPASDLRVIAGQATVAVELLRQCTHTPDVIIVPVGGGGLSSGTSVAVKYLSPETLVIGAEPLGADDAKRSLAAGHIIPQEDPRTIADGLRTSIYPSTFTLLRKNIHRIITVDEPAIFAATQLIWERMKILAEPSSATTLAVVLSDEFAELARQIKSRGDTLHVALVLSGGNVDFKSFRFPS